MAFMDINLTGTTFTDYHLLDVGAAPFQLEHDWFTKEDLVIRTAAGGGGTLLVPGSDYTFGLKCNELSSRVSAAGPTRTVYGLITITNAAYQTGDLYFSGKYIADSNSAADLNDLGGDLAAHAVLTGSAAHGAVSAPTANEIVSRDANGRAQVASPAVAADIARKDTVDTHAALTGSSAHGAVSAPTANQLMHRDASGRSQVAAPSAAADIARKDTVDAVQTNLNTHAALTGSSAHGAVSAPTANQLMARDASGRSQVAAPAAAADIARKDNVDLVQTNLNTHAGLTSTAHGAVSAPTVSTLMARDASGRSQVVAPSAAADIARKDNVDAVQTNLNTHTADTTAPVHGSAVAATINTLVHRDGSGRAQIAAPSAAADIVNKGTLDTQIATRVPTSRQIIAGTGLSGGGDLSADRTLTLAIPHYDTGWLLNEIGGAGVADWTNVHLGSTPTADSNVTHGLNSPLHHLVVKLFISTDGTDANSFECFPAGAYYGWTTYYVDANNLKIQTYSLGLVYSTDAGVATPINTQDWYYRIVVWKLG